MAARLHWLGAGTRVLDIGSGYGGSARYLASTHGCRVVAVNLSGVDNERHRRINAERGLDRLIEVVDASFEEIPAGDDSFDAAWSQDAMLHGGDRARVLSEVARVLRPGGEFVFTDPMRSDDCPDGGLQPILDRLRLEDLGSPAFYRSAARAAGMVEISFEDLSEHLPVHYARVLEETERRERELSAEISADYLARMKEGLRHWVEGGRAGYLVWGIFHFRV